MTPFSLTNATPYCQAKNVATKQQTGYETGRQVTIACQSGLNRNPARNIWHNYLFNK
jgi:hypothetical protein